MGIVLHMKCGVWLCSTTALEVIDMNLLLALTWYELSQNRWKQNDQRSCKRVRD